MTPSLQTTIADSDHLTTVPAADGGPVYLRHLRPCSPPEVLDRAVTIITGHFPTLGLLALLTAIPEVVGLYLQPRLAAAAESKTAPDLMPILMILGSHVLAVLPSIALLAGCFLALIRPQRRTRLLPLIQFAFGRWGAVLLAQIALVFSLVILLVSMSVLRQAGPIGGLLSMVLAITAFFWGIRLMLAWPIIILESRPLPLALQRSNKLTSSVWVTTPPPEGAEGQSSSLRRPIFSRNLMILMVPIIALMMAGQALVILLPDAPEPTLVQGGLVVVTSLLMSLLVASGLVSLYADTLVRSEAWDLEFRILAEETAHDQALQMEQCPGSESATNDEAL